MVSIRWCLKQKKGIEIVEVSENISQSYIRMARESLDEMEKVESDIWLASISYYSIYYSLYSLMMKIGVKCEIHSCSIEFMKMFLKGFYDENEVRLFERAFSMRNNLQYYPGRFVDKTELLSLKKEAGDFFIKTKSVVATISEKNINEIRNKLKKVIYE